MIDVDRATGELGPVEADGAAGEDGTVEVDVAAGEFRAVEQYFAAGELRVVEADRSAGELRPVEADDAAGEFRAVEVDDAAGEFRAVETDDAAGEHRTVEADDAAREHRAGEVGRSAGEHRAGEIAAVEDDGGEVEVVALPGMRVSGRKAQVVPDEADDRVTDLPQAQVRVPGLRVVPRQVGLRRVRQAQIGAQDVDARLARLAGGGVVGEAGQGVHAPEAHGGGLLTQLGDGGGEALGMQPGGVPPRPVLVDALTPVGHDQGDQGTGPGDHAERQLHQVEQRLRGEPALGLEALGAEQVPGGQERRPGHGERGDERHGENGPHRPQVQAAPFGAAPGQMFSHPPRTPRPDGRAQTACRRTRRPFRSRFAARG